MTLHEAIELVLKQNNRPLSAKDIASIINSENLYVRQDEMPVESNQIQARIKHYPSIFDSINGQIVLVSDKAWKKLLSNFNFLKTIISRNLNVDDIQFILTVLLFYKRNYDLNIKEETLKILPNLRPSITDMADNGARVLNNLASLDLYELGAEGVFLECSQLLSNFSGARLDEIFVVLGEIDTKEFDKNSFGDVFEYFLGSFPYSRTNNALTPTPYSLRQLMIALLSPTVGSTVHDPVAGTGGLLIEAYKKLMGQEIFLSGNELHARTAQFGNMNLAMHGINAKIKVEDSFYDDDNCSYDYIVADLPILGKNRHYRYDDLYRMFGLVAPRSASGIGMFALLILSKLNDKGKAIMTVSEGFLANSGKDSYIRKLLLDRDVVETVISLPFGTLKPYTEGKASLLVLNKNKPVDLKNKIRFITAKIEDEDGRSINLNNDDILKAYATSSLLSPNAQVLEISELNADANLSADNYGEQYFITKHMLRDGTGRLLSDLVTIKSGIMPDKIDLDPDGLYPLVKIENLSKEILETDLALDFSMRVSLGSDYKRFIISESCLLIARLGENVKPTIFRPSLQTPSIIVHSGVYALIPIKQNDYVSLEYLYYQLYSSVALEQIKKKKLGSVLPSISIKSLKNIIIPYVNPARQREFIKVQVANLISEEKLRANAVLRALGSKDEIRQSAETGIVKTLTHQLRPKLMEINSLASRIKRIADNEGINQMMEYSDLDDLVDPEVEDQLEKHDNFSLEMLIKKMVVDSEQLSNVLTVVDKVMNFKLSHEDLVETNIFTLLNEFKERKDITIKNRFKIILKGENSMAEINSAALMDLFDQLLKNAEEHGFIDGADKKYRVQFSVKTIKDRNVVVIDYNNNGAPFELEQKDFVNAFAKGRRSKGSGIGGNYINRIIEAHGGKLTVEENNPHGFALTIEIPIKQQ
ncbi:N-6 DNA methylase [Sphingobacterium paramultivorum]|uniref:N-6 DNA methylase n=1 Tax=Sphingobacterium paramultivorum TaxID=2886510 RepID=UPI00129D06DC|nr:N-6 DNA methylase [Sphingobacterium paramultivorum]